VSRYFPGFAASGELTPAVYGFGSNQWGELGNGTTTPSQSPVRLPILTGITQVAAGVYDALALKSDGAVWAS
jgi:alpha-tubulin suppressor-like RCC1 family protein